MHALIFRMRSPFFRGLLASGMAEAKVRLRGDACHGRSAGRVPRTDLKTVLNVVVQTEVQGEQFFILHDVFGRFCRTNLMDNCCELVYLLT